MNIAVNAFEIKSASLDILAILLRTANLEYLAQVLKTRFGQSKGVIPGESFMLDVEGVAQPETVNYAALLPLFRQYGIQIVALRHSTTDMAWVAQQHGLAYSNGMPTIAPELEKSQQQAKSPVESGTMMIKRPVRAGQQIYAKGGDLVVLDVVSAGAEIIADGNIHVYAPLRGRALAGARGDQAARIFTQAMEAELISIAGVYRPIDQALPSNIAGKPTQVYLEKKRLVMAAL